ncbi:MAG TPA: hypothetical protein VGO98_02895 [Candidatus Saccharimonadales bacterium]|jgi:hypothetical protein|nr:hypothetical protein [Candidatus Saccharimonadales bacterium]
MDISTASLTKSITHFLHRYHVILFVIVVLGAVGAGIFINYQHVLSVDQSHGYSAQSNNTTFDKETRGKLVELQTADYRLQGAAGDDAPRNLPIQGRLNPFVE